MSLLKKLTQFSSKRKNVWIVCLIWVFAAGLLSGIAPSVNDYKINTGAFDLPEDMPSVMGQEALNSYFPEEYVLSAIIVLYNEQGIQDSDLLAIKDASEWLSSEDKPVIVKSTVPFYRLPDTVINNFISEDQTTLIFPVSLERNQEIALVNDTVKELEQTISKTIAQNTQLYITGPAGIASDTIAIFASADLVLLFSTIALVLVLLVIIYRSPLLAIIPLLIVGVVYQVVDRILGIITSLGWFHVEAQSISIVMILLFGACTDYCLFIFSRFREELKKVEDKYEAMQRAMQQLTEPIFFSGGTVLAAMLVLLVAKYQNYNNFAPVFSITMLFILLAGLTLIPAVFTILGRKSFYPFIPKVGDAELKPNGFWSRIGKLVTEKPLLSGGLVLVMMIIFASNLLGVQLSYNIMKSFPEDMSSRIGYEIIEANYPSGDLAPTTVIITSATGAPLVLDEDFISKVSDISSTLEGSEGVSSSTFPSVEDFMSLPEWQKQQFISANEKAIKFQLTLEYNPYDQSALDVLDSFKEQKDTLINNVGLSKEDYSLYFAGETAKQSDVRALSTRDTTLAIIIITVVILIMLGIQTKSIVAPIYMMSTILISYISALGISWFVFHNFLGMEAISYRIPLYSFVFLVALGVDYNIILISRIREEAKKAAHSIAIRKAVALTGGVISSAGIILAATFGVLMTQPLQELYMFGFTVSLGILMDAFLVRGILVPSIVQLLGKWNWYPNNIIDTNENPNEGSNEDSNE
ncbi:MMPL family transporter [Desulfuribacillus alkaliarsenatis]|uniref:Multidrug transporter n=1 Tax=Desulfuribacillus alkaliarsenatis TaxID=766136 RepID=A0A1E5FYQ9_9FIRM|nr:MMPL family transporter [Desulfuribacillus alkaliarsenatis]OEF95713.1 multidrug transporter [Desulfuribacillus alkaliarsenatis]